MRDRRLRCVFRVAAGPRIGFGHLMRARTLARALGVVPLVSLRGGRAAAEGARAAGCTLVGAGADPLATADVLVVDDPSPEATEQWVARARARGLATVSVHDLGRGHSSADLVVDATAPYPRRSGDARRTLLGTRYYLLDASRRPVRRSRQGQRVLIALGGGAHVRRAARPLVEAIARRCPSADIAVAAGFGTTPPKPLPRGRWLVSRRGLAPRLAAADVAVVAGGVTLFEACALGRPVVGLAVVRPQRTAITSMARAGAVLDAGGPHMGPATAGRVARLVAGLVADPARGRALGTCAARLVDGRGAARVAAAVRALARARGQRD